MKRTQPFILVVFGFIALMNVARNPRFEAFHTRRRVGVDGLRRGFSPVRQFDPYTRPRLARWPIPGRLSQCLLLPVHVWLTAKLGADVPAETSSAEFVVHGLSMARRSARSLRKAGCRSARVPVPMGLPFPAARSHTGITHMRVGCEPKGTVAGVQGWFSLLYPTPSGGEQ